MKTWKENEAPVWRWILAAVLGIVFGAVVGAILARLVNRLPFWEDGQFLAPERNLIVGVTTFVGLFLGFWMWIRLLCKTSLRAFCFGRERKADVKTGAITGGLYLVGLFLGQLLTIKEITYDHQPVSIVLINLLLCLLLVWIQTTWEELVFRGLFLRIPFKDKMPGVRRGLVAAIVSSLLFMSAHLYNPEVTTQSGLSMALSASVYFITAFFMFLSNLMIGGMEGGLAIHFVNNFFCFFFVRAEVTALETPAIFVDHTQADIGLKQLLAIFITYIPPMIYLTIRAVRGRERNRTETEQA